MKKIPSFFKLLKQKINKYDKFVQNPFEDLHYPITIIWISEEENNTQENKNN